MARGSCGREHGARRRDRKGWVAALCPGTPKHPRARCPPLPGVPGRCPRSRRVTSGRCCCHHRVPRQEAQLGLGVFWVLPALGVLGGVRVGWRCGWLGWALGRGGVWCGTLVALWLMLDVDVGAEPSLGGSQWGAAFVGGVSCGTVPQWVCTRFCRGLCALFGVTAGWWLEQPCPTPAVSLHPQPWPPR